ncbi:hypothetical protein ScPMuIL_006375 [Solemya velum]
MESNKVQFVGAPCGHHGPYTFYRSFKYFSEEKCRILSLGEFFFVKIFADAPVSIGELQLLWEDKNNSQLLSSVRLYFLPENTPAGKQAEHGEDELLAVSEKLILKLDDLMTLIKNDVIWTAGRAALCDTNTHCDNSDASPAVSADSNDSRLEIPDVDKERVGDEQQGPCTSGITILNYARYCRYRAILKRVENVTDKWLKNAIVCAIGGFTAKTKNNRILFCRNEFYHPDLDDHHLRCDELAPNLKGRPRKKRWSMQKESSKESDGYETNSDTTTTPPPTGKRNSALRNGFSINKEEISEDEQRFLLNLHKFMRTRNTPIGRIPSLGFKQVDLYYFYTMAQRIGGYEQITRKRMWKHLYDKMGGDPSSTSAATCTRRHYEKLLLPYERHHKGEATKMPVSPVKFRHKRGRKKDPKLGIGTNGKQQTINARIKKRTRVIYSDYRKNSSELGVGVDKEKKWNEIRKQKAIERNKMRKTVVRKRTVKAILNGNIPSKSNGTESRPVRHRPTQRTSVSEHKPFINVKQENRERTQKSENVPLKEKAVPVIASIPKREKQETVQVANMSATQPQVQLQHLPNSVIMSRGVPVVRNNPAMYLPYPVYAMGSMYPFNMPIVPSSSYGLPMSPFLPQAAGNNTLQNATPPHGEGTHDADKMKNDISNSRPSVIQHTPSSVASLPVSNNSSVAIPTVPSHPSVSRHPSHNAVSHMNSTFPFSKEKLSPDVNSQDDQTEQNSFPSSLFPHTLKRQRVEDVLNPNKVLCKSLDMNTKQKMRKKSLSEHSDVFEQPKDLSMKTMRLLESKINNNNIVKKISDPALVRDIPQDLTFRSPNITIQEHSRRILPRPPSSPSLTGSCSSENSQRQKAPLCSNTSLANTMMPTLSSGLPSTSPVLYSTILPSKPREVVEGASSEQIIMKPAGETTPRPVTSPVDLSAPALHPAFPKTPFQQQPQQQYTPEMIQAMQLQQLYRAQMQARMAFEQLRQQNKMYLHQVPVKQQSHERGGDLTQSK